MKRLFRTWSQVACVVFGLILGSGCATKPVPVLPPVAAPEEKPAEEESPSEGEGDDEKKQAEDERAKAEEAAKRRMEDFQMSYAIDLIKGLSAIAPEAKADTASTQQAEAPSADSKTDTQQN